MSAEERTKIQEVIARFSNSFDVKDWSGLEDCFTLDPGRAACRASMIVWRKSEVEESTSHCVYEFQLTKHQSDWKISGITQKVLWNEGAASIHKGAERK